MAKQLKQLRNFLEGTNSAPSASDIPDESPTYSLNLETLDEEGKLKGGRKNVPLIANDSYLQYYINLGANETSGEIKYCYTLFGEDSTKVSKTIDNNTPVWLQNKLLRKSFRSLLVLIHILIQLLYCLILLLAMVQLTAHLNQV